MATVNVDVSAFQQRFDPQQLEFYRPVLVRHGATIKVKRETTALPNLQKILLQTLTLSHTQGFQAMGLRELSTATGISLGALYSYIDSKEHLLRMLLEHVDHCLSLVISEVMEQGLPPRQTFETLVRSLLYLSEALQPWVFFALTEGRHLPASEGVPLCEQRLASAIEEALDLVKNAGGLRWADTAMAATLIKPIVQEWALHHGSFALRALPVEHYADAAIAFIEQSLLNPA